MTAPSAIEPPGPPPPDLSTTDRGAVVDAGFRGAAVGAGVAILAILGLIALSTTIEAWPAFRQSGLGFVASDRWAPSVEVFGAAAMVFGTVVISVIALVLAVPVSIGIALFTSEMASNRMQRWIVLVIDLLAAVPSVVYGLWGVLFVVPLIREFIAPVLGGTLGTRFPLFAVTNPSGYSVLAGAIVLAIMVFPLIVAITDEVLRNIPQQMRESTLALGATRWETTWCVARHAGLPGIAAAVVLGFSRAFGETLAIMMVIGNTPQIPRSIFDAAYPLPALIANAYSEMMSIPQYQSALMLAALVLLVIVLVFNIAARRIIVRLGARV